MAFAGGLARGRVNYQSSSNLWCVRFLRVRTNGSTNNCSDLCFT